MQELNQKKRDAAAAKPRAPRPTAEKAKPAKPAKPARAASKKAEQPTLFTDDSSEAREVDAPLVAEIKPAVVVAETKDAKPAKASSSNNGFATFGFHESLLAALDAKEMTAPNDVQKQLLPAAVLGRDIATTIPQGNGKTALFLMIAAQRLLSGDVQRGATKAPSVLILVSNKDAALKGQSHAGRLLANTGLTATAIFENGDVQRQEGALAQGVDIVFATPARALEFAGKGSLEWSSLSTVLIDDLSELLKAGAGSDTEYLLKSLIKKRLHSVYQSTWWNSWSLKMADTYLLKPISINVKKGAEPRLVNVQHTAYVVEADQKFQVLLGTLRHEKKFTIVFANTKIVADWIGYKLATNGAKVEVCLNVPAPDRKADIVKAAEEGKLHTLVVTSDALGDMKFNKTTNVMNFDSPETADAFVKRAELTKTQPPGHYFTIVCDDYGHNMLNVEAELEQSVSVRPVPPDFFKLEDKSDFPFDETGRVKAIPNNLRVIAVPVVTPAPVAAAVPAAPTQAPVAAVPAPAAPRPTFQPKPIDRVAEGMPSVPLVASEAPMPPTLDTRRPAAHAAGAQPQQRDQQPSSYRPRDRGDNASFAGAEGAPPQQPRHSSGQQRQDGAAPVQQGQKPYQSKQANGGGYQQQQGGRGDQPQFRQQREERFDERARESAEGAREAARAAAGQGASHSAKIKPSRVGYERPEGGIVDLASETLTTAVELVQLRVMEAIEDAFVPPLSRLLDRLKEARDRRLRR